MPECAVRLAIKFTVPPITKYITRVELRVSIHAKPALEMIWKVFNCLVYETSYFLEITYLLSKKQQTTSGHREEGHVWQLPHDVFHTNTVVESLLGR